MRKFLLFFIFIISQFGFTQDCSLSIKATILDFHDAKVLERARVEVIGTGIVVFSDSDGTVLISGLCAKQYTLRIQHADCEDLVLSVDLSNGSIERKIYLEHHYETLESIRLYGVGYREDQSVVEQSLEKYRLSLFSGASLGDVLAEIPGVSRLKTGNNIVKPVINGLHSSRITMVNNGLRLQDQEWGLEHAPNIDQNSIDKVRLVKGPSALRYGGEAIGGTIVLERARPIAKDTLMGQLISEAVTNGRGGSITPSFLWNRQSGWFAGGNIAIKKLGDLRAPGQNLANTGLEQLSFNLSAGKRLLEYGFEVDYSFFDTEIGILRASHLGNLSDLVAAINDERIGFDRSFSYDINSPKQEVRHQSLKLGAYKRFQNFGKWSLDYSFQQNDRKEFDIRRGENRNRASLDLELMTHQLQTRVVIDAIDTWVLETGIDALYQENIANPDTGVRRLIPDFERYATGGFATAKHYFTESSSLEAGLRFDYHRIEAQKFFITSRWEALGYDIDFPQFVVTEVGNQLFTRPEFDYTMLSASLQYTRQINEKYDFSLTGGIANRPPNPSELFSDGLHHALATIELGDLRLNTETAYSVMGGVNARYKQWRFGLNPFFKYIDGFILLEPTGVEQTIRGAFPVFSYRQTDARFLGVDAQVEVNVHRFFDYRSSWSYTHATDVKQEQAIIDIPGAQWLHQIDARFSETTNWSFHLRATTQFRQTRYPDNDFTAPIPQSDGSIEDVLVNISRPPSGYTLVDVWTTWKTHWLSSKKSLEFRFFIDNVFNTSYRDYLNRHRFFADEVGTNFRIQSIFTL
ncbi:MAG: TonB-dependent receptor [Flavobacteriaceae bacterium]|nr:TonB-dependent receptor [Flavobacteriaceae bacterium]